MRGLSPGDLPPGRVVTLLVVDDDPTIVEGLCRLLEAGLAGVRAVGTTRADEAIDLVEREHPVLVIAAYRRPRMDGVALLTEVRGRAPEVLRVLLGGDPDPMMVLRGINEAAIDHFVVEPWDDLLLLDALEGLLRARRYDQQREQGFRVAEDAMRRRGERGGAR